MRIYGLRTRNNNNRRGTIIVLVAVTLTLLISVAALCLALKLSPYFIAAIANLAGGLFCEKVGVVPIDKQQLLEEVYKVNKNIILV